MRYRRGLKKVRKDIQGGLHLLKTNKCVKVKKVGHITRVSIQIGPPLLIEHSVRPHSPILFFFSFFPFTNTNTIFPTPLSPRSSFLHLRFFLRAGFFNQEIKGTSVIIVSQCAHCIKICFISHITWQRSADISRTRENSLTHTHSLSQKSQGR